MPRAVVKVWEEALNKMLRAKRVDSILGLNRNDEFEKARKELLTFWRQKLHKAQSDNDLLKEFFGEKPDYFLGVEKGKVSFIDALPDQEQVEIFFWKRIEDSFTNWAKNEEKFPEDWTNSIHQSLKDELKQKLFDDFSSVLKEQLKENERAWKSFEFASSLQTVSMLQSLKMDTNIIKEDLVDLIQTLPLVMKIILKRFNALDKTIKDFLISNQNINGLLNAFRKEVIEKLGLICNNTEEIKELTKYIPDIMKMLEKMQTGQVSENEDLSEKPLPIILKKPSLTEKETEQQKLEYLMTKFNDDWSYHINRVKCSIYQTEADTVRKIGDCYFVENEASWKKLEEQFHNVSGRLSISQPAGSWYLVSEQAHFLERCLAKIFSEFENNSEVKILEAGSASYIHHFTYFSIVLNALKKSGKKLKLNVTTIDKHPFPLEQISKISELLRAGKLECGGVESSPTFNASQIFCSFIENSFDEKQFFDTESITITADLSDKILRGLNYKFDIITEHFLTYPKLDDYDSLVSNIRRNYQSFLDEKLHLICAFGAIADRVKSFDYFKFHEDLGFQVVEQ